MSEPLLSSSRPSSEHSDEGASAEDSLLRGEPVSRQETRVRRRERWVKAGLGLWAALATIAVIALGLVLGLKQQSKSNVPESFPPEGKRNVIFMVSDGMGPTALSVTRSFLQHTQGLPYGDTLTLDKHFIGSSRTRSSSSLVTDSAAGATAFSCGMKSYNGAISVLPNGEPCGTVLEAAKLAGYMTGLVVTTRLTDATPACFSAHVNMRGEEDRIAEQQLGDYPLGLVVDLMLGGGRCHFLPNTTEGSCRADARDLVSEAQKEKDFSYVSDRKSFDSLENGNAVKLPLLGLFAETDIPYDLDRDDAVYPSLHEMAETALNALEAATKNSDKGFFLMVEGSRIDHAGHANDPSAQVREVLAYDKAFAAVLEWASRPENKAVVVSTSDHETGGSAAARQLHASYPEYLWYPGALANASKSGEYLSAKYSQFSGSSVEEDIFLQKTIIEDGLGIHDASKEEIQDLKNHKESAIYILNDMISRRAQIGWSTHGHSAADVAIFGNEGTSRLAGNHENTEVGEFLREYLDLDVDAVTKLLKKEGVGRVGTAGSGKYPWMGRTIEEINEGMPFETDHLDHYHGDFRKHKH